MTPHDTTSALVYGMFRAYCEHWAAEHERIDVIESERTYTSPLFRIGTADVHPTFGIAGKIDKLITIDGRKILVDHKTTSMDLAPDATYWRQIQIDSQHHHYELLLLAAGTRLDGIMYDVTRKPLIRQRTKRQPETLEEYSERVRTTMLADTDRYFARRYINRTTTDLHDYARELSQLGDDIQRCRDDEAHYRNPGACMMYGSPCGYLGICSGVDVPESDNWQTKEVHSEIDVEDPQNVLTNSRIRCWQTCRRKHFYRYELAIERIDAEERTALTLGTMWHELLDEFWAR